ncbi:MAG TPA: DUF998 domain-containing protein [Euzebyales bacterium]|nr:DUF998 domain-containing protein [Euzebyales bacterium]
MAPAAPADPATRLRLGSGIAGPLFFTAAWVTATLRQHGHGQYHVAREHISGLAAPDARNPRLMTAAFLVLGVTTNLFGAGLRDVLGGVEQAGAGPRLVRIAGLATVLAGLLRRDRMLLGLPEGVARQSWRNDGHDLASGIVYASLIAAPAALARRFHGDVEHERLRVPALTTSALTAAVLALFASRRVEPYNGLVQRLGVTVPALASAALAARLLRASSGRTLTPALVGDRAHGVAVDRDEQPTVGRGEDRR